MPVLFAGFALLVWLMAARFRREPVSFAVVGAALVLLIGVNILHTKIKEWTQGEIHLPVLRSLMYPYTGFVAGVGLYIACLPKRNKVGCGACGYDLTGLMRADGWCRCPECGAMVAAEVPRYRRSGMDRRSLMATDLPATPQAVHGPAGEDQQREPGDQRPAHGAESARGHGLDPGQ